MSNFSGSWKLLITSRDKLMFYDFFGDFQLPRIGLGAFHLSFHFSTCFPLVFYLCSLVLTCVLLVFTFVHLCSFVFTCVHLCSLVFYLCSTCVHLCSLVFICVHLCSFVFLLVWCFRLDRFRVMVNSGPCQKAPS